MTKFKILFDKLKSNKEPIGYFIKRYWLFYSIILGVIAFLEVVMAIRGLFIFKFSNIKHVTYFISYILLFLSSVSTLIVILLVKKKNLKNTVLFYVLHVYALMITIWACIVSYLDLISGNYPIVYLTIIIVLAGIVVLDPVFFTVMVSISLILLLIQNSQLENTALESRGSIINIIVFAIMSLFVAFKHYNVNLSEAKSRNFLRNLVRTDQLTGLGNETSYFTNVDEINKLIESNNIDFAVMVMDVNGLKATNDAYGHRYGCHLVVETGHILPTIFKTSKLFHIGGDEFVCIIMGDDLDNFDNVLNDFKNKLEYQKIHFEGKELILSLAHGYAYCEEGMIYQDVFQKADENMYANKKEVKEKYNIMGR